MTKEQTARRNRQFFEYLGAVRAPRYRQCLFSDDCKREVINAHSIAKSVLKSIADDGHVRSPKMTFPKSGTGIPKPDIQMVSEGINQASTGTFACHYHDDLFREAIDQTPIQVGDPHVQNLLLYRAVLRELWWLLATLPVFNKQEHNAPLISHLISPSNHPRTRIESLIYLKKCLGKSMGFERTDEATPPVRHMVRGVKTNHPIPACSYAYGGSTVGLDGVTGEPMTRSELQEIGIREPYECWGFTVIPERKEHTVLLSWLEGSNAEAFFTHFNNIAGKELEAAVSAELILFCERWLLSPKVWNGYNEDKRRAILDAFDNGPKLLSGGYRWIDRGKQPWHEFAGVPNRHQLNLFRYDPIIFTSRP